MHRFGVAGVSIPFIAGQWSLREAAWLVEVLGAMSQSPSLRGSGRFRRGAGGSRTSWKSQSPSLRGSGRFCPQPPTRRSANSLSQSPSLRGSGRFIKRLRHILESEPGLNPLHCGAVVASNGLFPLWTLIGDVSIPFIAGQWSLLSATADEAVREQLVSIPFIAGQWSLQTGSSRFGP